MKRFTLPQPGRNLGLLMAATGMFLVSTDSLLVRVAQPSSGWTISFMVGVWSTPIIAFIARKKYGNQLVNEIRKYGRLLVVTGLLSALSTTAFMMAVTLTAAANVVAIIAAAPILAAVIARLAINEHATARTWRSIGLTTVGIIVIVGGAMAKGGVGGDLLALVAITGFSVNLTIWRRHPNLPRILVVLSAAVSIALITAIPAQPFTMDVDALWATLIMGAFFGPLARFLLASATQHAPAAEVSLFTPVETVCATAWVWVFFDEPPTTTTVLGALVVIAAVTYGITGPAAEMAPEPDPHR